MNITILARSPPAGFSLCPKSSNKQGEELMNDIFENTETMKENEHELSFLNRQVAASSLNREEYLRTLIVGKEIHPRPCTHHADLLRKVAGLCNNANQLAHRANSTGTAGQGSVDEMTRLTQEVWREVKENW